MVDLVRDDGATGCASGGGEDGKEEAPLFWLSRICARRCSLSKRGSPRCEKTLDARGSWCGRRGLLSRKPRTMVSIRNATMDDRSPWSHL